MEAKYLGRTLFFIIIALMLASIAFYYTRPDYQYGEPEFPTRRVIKNTEGKSIDVVIIGKMNGVIYFSRMPDNEKFELPLNKLSLRDRAQLFFFRDQAPPVEEKEDPKFADNYVKNRLKQIEELEKKLRVMQIEMASGTLSSPIQSNYDRRTFYIRKEIETLRTAIETHRYRLKKN